MTFHLVVSFIPQFFIIENLLILFLSLSRSNLFPSFPSEQQRGPGRRWPRACWQRFQVSWWTFSTLWSCSLPTSPAIRPRRSPRGASEAGREAWRLGPDRLLLRYILNNCTSFPPSPVTGGGSSWEDHSRVLEELQSAFFYIPQTSVFVIIFVYRMKPATPCVYITLTRRTSFSTVSGLIVHILFFFFFKCCWFVILHINGFTLTHYFL